MQENAQASQSNSFNLGNVCAYKLTKKNAYFACLQLWLSNGNIFECNIATSNFDELIAEIDESLANGEYLISTNFASFHISEKLLLQIRKELLTHTRTRGGSDAHVASCGVSTPTKSKASAMDRNLPSRQSSNNPKKRQDGSLAENDADVACAPKSRSKLPKGWRNCNVENPLRGQIAVKSQKITTKNGRTSVVVSSKKVNLHTVSRKHRATGQSKSLNFCDYYKSKKKKV